jgi:hypothetical protein
MKRIFTLLFALGTVAFASAQQKQQINGAHQIKLKPRALSENEIRAAKENGTDLVTRTEAASRGAMFFSEDFANGVDGNNSYGAWTIDDVGNDAIWMLATAESPAGCVSVVGRRQCSVMSMFFRRQTNFFVVMKVIRVPCFSACIWNDFVIWTPET